MKEQKTHPEQLPQEERPVKVEAAGGAATDQGQQEPPEPDQEADGIQEGADDLQ